MIFGAASPEIDLSFKGKDGKAFKFESVDGLDDLNVVCLAINFENLFGLIAVLCWASEDPPVIVYSDGLVMGSGVGGWLDNRFLDLYIWIFTLHW